MLKILSRNKKIIFLLADVILICFAVYLAFLLRFEGDIPARNAPSILRLIVLANFFLLSSFYYFKLYSFSWNYVSSTELISLAKAILFSFLAISVIFFGFAGSLFFWGFPRSTLIISFILIFLFCGAIRFAKRVYLDLFRKKSEERERALIVGAGDAGEQILDNILSSPKSDYNPIGFVDDDPLKQGILIHGVKVLGKIQDIPQIVRSERVEGMIVALPSIGSKIIRQAVELGRQAKLQKIRIIPELSDLINGRVSLSNLRNVEMEDLLGRAPVLLDKTAIADFLSAKRILITGAAGSIGSELSRQIARFNPSLILLLDQDETGIFNITEELKDRFPRLKIVSLVVDITDSKKIKKIFQQYCPQAVFHAAAYKHVPLMEENSDEAVKNNIFGTKTVAGAAKEQGVEKFIFISTDKAVNPTSVMGATKRIGEMICQSLSGEATKFISVRFGNVLNSRGSVIPIFREQIKKGGPVEITHPDMKRYFMITSEACLLVMQAGAMGRGGEVFVLDMGEPVKILDLAREMIRFSGLTPDKDIPIVFTGVRPGEKLFEEILSAEEGTIATQNRKIFAVKLSPIDKEKLNMKLTELTDLVYKGNTNNIEVALKEIIPNYRSNNHG